MLPQIFKGGLKPALLFWLVTGLLPLTRAEPVVIRWLADSVPQAVEVDGIPREVLSALSRETTNAADSARVFVVFAQQGSDATSVASAMPPMAGQWSVVGDRLRFEPRFPLTRGVRYRAEFREAAAPPVVSFFMLPADTAAPTTVIEQVFPSTDQLPENVLKFYIQFSAPMSRGGVYEHIRLREVSGGAIEQAFLELGEELWDPTMTRLTLLIDPGRIKRGVKPLEDIGAVFEAGKNYALTIAAACRDAAGRPLRSAFEKKFRVVAADRTAPDPARWKVLPPAGGTREPLTVEFDEPMDHALAIRVMGVVRGTVKGPVLHGDTALAQQERRWTFVPGQPWERGPHRVTVQTTIEDLAGNNIGKTFDVDLFEDVQRRIATAVASIPFEVH